MCLRISPQLNVTLLYPKIWPTYFKNKQKLCKGYQIDYTFFLFYVFNTGNPILVGPLWQNLLRCFPIDFDQQLERYLAREGRKKAKNPILPT